MAAKIVDASAIAAILFDEPGADAVGARLEGCTLFAPALLWFELASVCLKKLEEHPEREADVMAEYGALDALPLFEAGVRHDEIPLLARRLGISAYDASYLELASRTRIELVTLDHRLGRAARRSGMAP
jgi:predicted nucleic acid-binding protein